MPTELTNATDLTFKSLCEVLKKEEPEFLDKLDGLLGLALICSPIFIGAAALPALGLLGTKNELIKIGKKIFERVVAKKEEDFLAHHQRMLMAYTLITFTSFFEALDRALSKRIRDQIALQPTATALLSRDAAEATTVDSFPIALPHPAEDLDQQRQRLGKLYGQMANGFLEFVGNLACWDNFNEKDAVEVKQALSAVPDKAIKCFDAQYFALSTKFPEFAIWANLHRHEQTQTQVVSLKGYVKDMIDLSRSSTATIDVGFAKLHETVLSIPMLFKTERAAAIVQDLRRHYEARLNDPIIEDRYEPHAGRPQLSFPKLGEAFIPQSYRVLRYAGDAIQLESEDTWRKIEARSDLGTFLLSYLSSPYSLQSPLLILGHPGSGKSLLTKVLSAALFSEQYTPIRVQLREVSSDASISKQIEEQIYLTTQDNIGSWARFIGQFKNNPPVVILDGYDELLQASGKVFSQYLNDAQDFQRNELELGRAIRVVVTSRVTLIDKAIIPENCTILRLLEFNETQRATWVDIWNRANAQYFRDCTPPVQDFSLPRGDDRESKNVIALAEQPLLLLMLALYDSEDNKLRRSKGLDRTALYEDLLRRFVRRERVKAREFRELEDAIQEQEIDRDIQRLGVVAIGMFSRRKLHVLTQELNEDLSFFDLERDVVVKDGRPLSQAEMLLGSFFFVHKSRALEKGGRPESYVESAAFEFLHNTFGEFLAADFTLKHAITETRSLEASKQDESLHGDLERKLTDPGGFSKAWFACLIYTPLFSRPVVLEMIREWMDHLLKRRHRSRTLFWVYWMKSC